jgi:hypothetical protein
VIKDLSCQLEELEKQEAPPVWEKFHSTLVESIRLQIKGYKEMVKVFDDSELSHIEEGQKQVNSGMEILQGGKKEG